MSCKALKLKGCEIKGSTFQGRKFTFPNRDISSDVFTLKIPKLNIEKQGVVNQNDVYFSYSDFEGFKEGLYAIEFWANFEGIGNELIAEETFVISLTSCGGGSSSNNTTFNLEFPEETIDYSVEYSVINIYDTGGTVTWENVTGKPTVFYDDTEIKEEIAEKVDKVEGLGLSENNFSDADLEKLAGLENFDPTDINNALGNKVDKIEGKVLSTNDYTTAEKNKLAGLDGNKFFGKFADETALSAVVGIIGGYAYVGGVGRNDESYIWDDDDLKWVKSNNIPTAETPASVKTKYESNPDTNAFTNARRDKLNNAVVASDLPTANVGSATKLQNARQINGTNFDGTANVTTALWGTVRTLTIGSSGKSVNGSANITWTLAEIGAASLDSAGQIPNAQIPTRLVDKVIAIGGEGVDRSFTGLYDRNQLALADKEHTVTTVLNGSGLIQATTLGFHDIIFNSKSNFVAINGCDSTTELIVTVTLSSTLNNYSRAQWQPFFQTRLSGLSNTFKNCSVEIMDTNNVWFTPANYIGIEMTPLPNSGIFLFPEGGAGTTNIKAIRFKLSNPVTSNGVVYLSNIGFRHVSHDFAPQYPNRGDNNTFFGINTFKKGSIVLSETFVPSTASSIANNTMFVDSADGKLKFKDGNGVLNNLY